MILIHALVSLSFIGLQSIIPTEAKLTLEQVVIISRHGSRGFLTKHHTTFMEGENSELTVRGMNQMYEAGQYVQRRYNGTIRDFLNDKYQPSEVYVRSSDYTRTMSSAQSFLLGLYPPRYQAQQTSYPERSYSAPYDIQQIPIHTVPVSQDQLLRGWLQCSTFQNRINQFYESEMFKKKEKDNAEFLKSLEKITDMENIGLKDFYNVYDYIHLHMTYGKLYLNITDIQWQKVQELADWLEYEKYNRNRIQSIGAGLLFSDIILNFSQTQSNKRKAKLLYYSAHYPTILSIFSLLGLNDAHKSLQIIPYYASLVFLELYKEEPKNTYYVKFAFRNGLQNDTGKDTFQYYSIPDCGTDMCSLARFDLFSSNVYSKQSWCSECNNVGLSECRVGKSNNTRDTTSGISSVGSFFIGFFVCLLLVIVLSGAWHFFLRKRCLDRRPRHGLPDFDRLSGMI